MGDTGLESIDVTSLSDIDLQHLPEPVRTIMRTLRDDLQLLAIIESWSHLNTNDRHSMLSILANASEISE